MLTTTRRGGSNDRIRLIGLYLEQAGFGPPELIDRSPANADPLWIVAARKR